jgi:NTE family protein
VGVVLSGGGADGISHIGFLKALEENNIPIDYIAGTSMGALIAGMYASGYSPAQMEEFVKKEKFKNWAEGEIEEKPMCEIPSAPPPLSTTPTFCAYTPIAKSKKRKVIFILNKLFSLIY